MWGTASCKLSNTLSSNSESIPTLSYPPNPDPFVGEILGPLDVGLHPGTYKVGSQSLPSPYWNTAATKTDEDSATLSNRLRHPQRVSSPSAQGPLTPLCNIPLHVNLPLRSYILSAPPHSHLRTILTPTPYFLPIDEEE